MNLEEYRINRGYYRKRIDTELDQTDIFREE
jgi:hypothetical protein